MILVSQVSIWFSKWCKCVISLWQVLFVGIRF